MSLGAICDLETGLKEGDTMDLMKEYDRANSKFIELDLIKSRLDQCIKDPRCIIVLTSTVKDVCNENVVDVEEPASRKGIMKIREVEAPAELKPLALDYFCALYHKRMDTLEYLGDFARNQAGRVN